MIAGIMETMSNGGIAPDTMVSAFGMDVTSVQSMVDITEQVAGLGSLDLLNMATAQLAQIQNVRSMI